MTQGLRARFQASQVAVGVAKRVRGERLFGYVGLGLFCLFPLVSALQLRDPDAVWRDAAERSRNSVVALYASRENANARPAACGVVIQDEPLRIVTSANLGEDLASPYSSRWIGWRRVHTDPESRFALFEATASPAGTEPAGVEIEVPTSIPCASAPTLQRVDAALVQPEVLVQLPLWVGTLRPEARPQTYRATDLRTVAARGVAAAAPMEIDPMLLGAPFVSREGSVVAVLASREASPGAVPIEAVTAALLALERHAARDAERMP